MEGRSGKLSEIEADVWGKGEGVGDVVGFIGVRNVRNIAHFTLRNIRSLVSLRRSSFCVAGRTGSGGSRLAADSVQLASLVRRSADPRNLAWS